jgi:ABC-2 type transport system permease protein
VAAFMAALMLGSVLLVNRISVIGDTILDAIMADGNSSVAISISLNEEAGETVIEVTESQEEGDGAVQPLPERPGQDVVYEVVPQAERVEEQWNFSREWTFEPETRDRTEAGSGDRADPELEGRELNVMLSVIHGILILILFLTSANYLLSSLYEDRKDRSILFWRSMPVAETQNVAAKLVTALAIAPAIYLLISILLQLVYVVLMVLLVWRMDRDPSEIIASIDFGALFIDPVSGWLMTALLIAPAYAWLLLASAFARRSPLGIALGVPVGLYLIERIFLGTEYVGNAITAHFPHVDEESAVGFYLFGPQWTGMDLLSIAGGLAFAALALTVTVWLRTHRWELN